MDGDGLPEVIAHHDAGDSWDDVILGPDHSTRRVWRLIAESIGGSTA